MTQARLHAGCVILRETGILIRGPSGAGKSSLALALVAEGVAGGGFAAHVADDRVQLTACHGRLLARPCATIAGLHEMRGIGLRSVAYAEAAILGLVVDLPDPAHPRLPPAEALQERLLGVALPRLPVPSDLAQAVRLVMWRIRGRDDTIMTDR